MSIIERLPTMDVHLHQLATVSELTGMRPSIVDASHLTGYIRTSQLHTGSSSPIQMRAKGRARERRGDDGLEEQVANSEAVTRYSLFIDEGFGAAETDEEAEARQSTILPVSRGML
jgi:hypothetical protein